jgi:hypothetical protein
MELFIWSGKKWERMEGIKKEENTKEMKKERRKHLSQILPNLLCILVFERQMPF